MFKRLYFFQVYISTCYLIFYLKKIIINLTIFDLHECSGFFLICSINLPLYRPKVLQCIILHTSVQRTAWLSGSTETYSQKGRGGRGKPPMYRNNFFFLFNLRLYMFFIPLYPFWPKLQ